MSKYGQFCPVARALEVIGDRWTLLIVRDLLHEVSHFNDLARGLPKLSRGLLSKRLKKLQHHGIVEVDCSPSGGYRLTRAGEELRPLVTELLRWGTRWTLDEPTDVELDPVLLMWWMQRRVRVEMLPPARQVVQFDFDEEPTRSFWLVLDPADVSVCFTPPPFDVDIWVEGSMSALYEVWLGVLPMDAAVDDGRIRFRALPWQERDFAGWFALSPGASVVAEEMAATRARLALAR